MTSDAKRKYRDGGYGWVVVMAAFFVGFITDGLTFSFGILLVDLLELFQSERGKTAVVGALVTMSMHVIGPVAGSLCDSYGYRVVVISGALLSAAGIAASMFVTQLPLLYVTYGLLGGAGFGLMYLPACVCVIHNFEKLRTIANGIAVSGSGAGMFVFNVLTRYLLDTYGLRGTFLIMSGLCLNGVVLGLLLNHPEQEPEESARELVDMGKTDLYETTRNTSIYIEKETTVSDACFESTVETELVFKPHTGDHNQRYSVPAENAEDNSTKLLPGVDETTNKPSKDARRSPSSCGRFKKALLEMCDIKLLRNLSFLAFLISCFCLNFAFIIPIHLLPDQAEQLHISKQKAAWIVSVLGIGNVLGRIIIGWLGDRKVINRFMMFVGCILCCGISTGLSPLLTSFEGKLVYACVYGLLIGGFVTLSGVILADMVGMDDMSKAYGLVLFVVGVSGAFGTPVGGWLFDVTGTYTTTFIIAGIVFVISGFIILLPKLGTCLKRNQCNKS